MNRTADITVGLGWTSSATELDVRRAITDTLAGAAIDESRVCCVATLERGETNRPLDTSWPVRTFSAKALAGVPVPTPSDRVADETGTASVAEAAALLAAGAGASLVVAKQRIGHVTVAVARSAQDRAARDGPGDPNDHRAPRSGYGLPAFADDSTSITERSRRAR